VEIIRKLPPWELGHLGVFGLHRRFYPQLLRDIRNRRISVSASVFAEQIAHYAYHCGQIVFLAKQFKAGDWKSLSVPRNRSAEFNQRVLAGDASQR